MRGKGRRRGKRKKGETATPAYVKSDCKGIQEKLKKRRRCVQLGVMKKGWCGTLRLQRNRRGEERAKGVRGRRVKTWSVEGKVQRKNKSEF